LKKVTTVKECLPVVVGRIFQRGDEVKEIIPLNNERHYLLITHKGMKYYLLFKRSFFMKYGEIFKDRGQKGVGESINVEYLKLARDYKVDYILIYYQDGRIYHIDPNTWFDFARRFRTIRTTKDGETTYSIPVSMLRRW